MFHFPFRIQHCVEFHKVSPRTALLSALQKKNHLNSSTRNFGKKSKTIRLKSFEETENILIFSKINCGITTTTAQSNMKMEVRSFCLNQNNAQMIHFDVTVFHSAKFINVRYLIVQNFCCIFNSMKKKNVLKSSTEITRKKIVKIHKSHSQQKKNTHTHRI